MARHQAAGGYTTAALHLVRVTSHTWAGGQVAQRHVHSCCSCVQVNLGGAITVLVTAVAARRGSTRMAHCSSSNLLSCRSRGGGCRRRGGRAVPQAVASSFWRSSSFWTIEDRGAKGGRLLRRVSCHGHCCVLELGVGEGHVQEFLLSEVGHGQGLWHAAPSAASSAIGIGRVEGPCSHSVLQWQAWKLGAGLEVAGGASRGDDAPASQRVNKISAHVSVGPAKVHFMLK